MYRRASMFLVTVMGLVFGLMTLNSTEAYGQAISGNIVGTVMDSSSAVVSNAAVEIIKTDTGAISATKTTATGGYRFENLPVGSYKMTVKSSGFKAVVQQFDVVLNQTATLNVTLVPGGTSEVVEVTSSAAPIDTTSAQMQSTYDTKFSQDLGVTSAGGLGSGVLNLSLLSPGVSQVSSLGVGVGPSVGGQRPYNNNFTVEGVDNNNKATTGNLISVPNDAVENFTLLENQFNTEFGHSSGGQFNTTIKSGTNSFHGSLYEYFRNRNLNAVDNFYVLQGLTDNPRYDSNRYGATFGGPIIKNKLFFFSNFERQAVAITATAGGQVLAPTQEGLTAIGADPNLSATNFGVFKQFVPVAAAQAPSNDPNALCKIGVNAIEYPGAPAAGTCAGGAIPIGAVSITAPAWQNFENFVQSVDYNVSTKDQIRGRYIYNKLDRIDNSANLPAFFTTEPFRFHLFTISEYHTFSPSVLNEFRVGYNRFFSNLPDGNFQYPGLDAFPNIGLLDLGGNGLTIGPDSVAPQFTVQNLYQFVDNVSWNKGNHNFKFGGEYRWYISPQSFTQRQRGDYEYNSTRLFLEDQSPDNVGERSAGSTTYYGNQKAVYWYANDSWKLNSHLVLNAGIRYEFTTNSSSQDQQALNIISNTPSIIVPGSVNQPLLFNKPQAPKNNWAPRVGFAYSPGSSGNTSIRGGFGLAYDVLYDNIGILAVPPQIGATHDVPDLTQQTPDFLKKGGLPGGGNGIQVLGNDDARANTSNWIPPHTKLPYSENWNFGIQHSFAKDFTAEVRYVGTRGVHLDVQSRINRRSLVTADSFLPTFFNQPSQADIDALPTSLADLKAPGSFLPEFTAAGFHSNITADAPYGASIYHGLQTQLNRHFRNGLTMQAAYTWSRTIDNSTADFFTTSLTPRRAQDFQDFSAERGVSALSRTHRLTIAAVYDLPYFKNGNWTMRNVVGNWSFSPVYTYESPQWATVQSAVDSNLNGDSAGDRAILNPNGIAGTGSDVTPLCRSTMPTFGVCGENDFDPTHGPSGPGNFDSTPFVVGYAANNPNAQFVVAGAGARSNIGRNTLATRPTNDFSLSTYKDLNITERFKFRIGAQFANLLNHPQYIPGSNPGQGLGVNDVTSFVTSNSNYLNYLTPGNAIFNNPKAVFASNARSIALVGKLTF
ncbi:MAG TPA: carboxypeptidase regulatory-like domain-containing protein [Terriglobales bacterium]|nr:carboxypeptidase regulatory-like domain-containing protein [Terriglobales bacterium]